MAKTNNGGPAHPTGQGAFNAGMSLRDKFAGQFAAAWVISLSRRTDEPGYDDQDVVYEANKLGLKQADSMLDMRDDYV